MGNDNRDWVEREAAAGVGAVVQLERARVARWLRGKADHWRAKAARADGDGASVAAARARDKVGMLKALATEVERGASEREIVPPLDPQAEDEAFEAKTGLPSPYLHGCPRWPAASASDVYQQVSESYRRAQQAAGDMPGECATFLWAMHDNSPGDNTERVQSAAFAALEAMICERYGVGPDGQPKGAGK